MSKKHRSPSVYDQLRPHLNAEDLLRRLGVPIERTSGSEVYCRPLCHESTSGESLQINRHTGRWNCKACQHAGVRGDLIQLVEYVLTDGQPPSHGKSQSSSPSHRQAVTWLCEQYGIPYTSAAVAVDPGLDTVHIFAMAAHEHLLGNEKMLAWIEERWGFDRATVEQYSIGFMPNPILAEIAAATKDPASRSAFIQSGLGWYDGEGRWQTRFAGRVTFPYLEHGRAVYLIGRATESTPKLDDGRQPPKYHKLSVHSEKRPNISEHVTNNHLYNETVMAGGGEVGIVEGVADAVALSSLGVDVVSPVTISFNEADRVRFLDRCRENGISRAWILFDNELSGAGNDAARRVGKKLIEGGVDVSVVTLPLRDEQKKAVREVRSALGDELFEKFLAADALGRRDILNTWDAETSRREWVRENIEAAKIDAAEWAAVEGAGAAGRFNDVLKKADSIIRLEIEDVAKVLDMDERPDERLFAFESVCSLVAHLPLRVNREFYAGLISKAAGKGVSKVGVMERVSAHRRDIVKPKLRKEKESRELSHDDIVKSMSLPPPDAPHVTPAAPPRIDNPLLPPNPPGTANDGKPRPAAPPPPGSAKQNQEEKYAGARESVARSIAAKVPEEVVGKFVAQLIQRSMGYTVFTTPAEMYLVRGSTRIAVDEAHRYSVEFRDVLQLAAGLTPRKSSQAGYIDSVRYNLRRDAKRVREVSWSHVDESRSVFFPTGDDIGTVLRISAGEVEQTRMAKARVPAVVGASFNPIEYVKDDGGVDDAMRVFRWTSLSEDSRMLLTYWVACLPILRFVGSIPILRIEGGSASGKTRTVDAVAYLVNGEKGSSVPTAAALTSLLATEMLTIDDNRETGDITPAFHRTLLQATHLGALEKRKASTDTNTVVERICGALLMNGIEPIHSGKTEIASRMLTLPCHDRYRGKDSPPSEEAVERAMLGVRDRFWSEAVRRCSVAMKLDVEHGHELGQQIEETFGASQIGRTSAYLRMMYLAWVAGIPEDKRAPLLQTVAPKWINAFSEVGKSAVVALVAEELSVSSLDYVFAYGRKSAERTGDWSTVYVGLEGKYHRDESTGEEFLGELAAKQLARFARQAAGEMHGPSALAITLRPGQLERRLLDAEKLLAEAGYEMDVTVTAAGKTRFLFRHQLRDERAGSPPVVGEEWRPPAEPMTPRFPETP